MSSKTRDGHRIVVLGGGYAGMTCALDVARRTRRRGGRVTLVNPSRRFTERLRLHQLAAGEELADVRIPDLLDGTGVAFVQGWARSVDTGRRLVRVDTADGERDVGYDTLVYAVGSVADTATVPGADSHAYTLDSAPAALALAARLAELPAGATVAVCGGGLTGIEAAAEIAENRPGLHVVLLSRDEPGAMMGPRARAYLHRALGRLGIQVRQGVEVVKVLPDAVELAGGETVAADACVWTTGCVPPPLAAQAGLTVDAAGRVVVDQTLRSVSHPSVYAIGDAAAIRQAWGTVHGTCQSGIPTAVHASLAIARDLRGRRPKRFRFGYIHQPVSLGRGDAVVQFTRPDDTPRRWYLKGRMAVAYKEFVSSSPPKAYRLMRRVTIPSRLLSLRGGRATRRPVPVP
jgi:NADH:ubiquinone reductase (H+-translocating)